ncbi:hypothetical protein HXX76_006007 [Chlamydomonas incerta]|uniref:PsbP C-terminal domain-containing protein n=1 Tax=Chlamydomonas incerta TaxID=51695 RepID=A0A835W1Q9_CHLIN|nr:hypothetical protein HXX76_006007 [Chlamydomonas incerta]|eukprot:KAG2437352.1 hypothetical protein HXX76_006007 [Chlamydomonas incerta]
MHSQSSGPGPKLSDPVDVITWGGRLPSRRRAVLGGLSGLGIALGGNLGGCTSFLLGLDGGQLAGRLRADVLIPVRGIKRCVYGGAGNGFEFTYPATWLGDQTLAYRAAKRAEAARGGPPTFGSRRDDFDDSEFPALSPSRRPAAQQSRGAEVAEPVVAFGPPGTTGEENVSVIAAPIMPGFSLDSLGGPRDAAERFLASLAPPSSGLEARLFSAEGRTDGSQLYYTLEYTVRGPRFFRHNVSVYTARSNQLYTFNAQCPETRWQEDAAALLASAASFRLT